MAVPNTQREARRDEDGGYTLVEIATVMLVIGALLMIAVVTFLNAQDGSQTKVAQTRARAALMANRSYFSENGTYPLVPADLKTVEPSLDYTDQESARVLGKVYVRNDANEVYIGTAKKDGKLCYWVKDSPDTGTWYAEVACDATAIEVEAALKRSW